MTKRVVMCCFPNHDKQYAYYTTDDSIQVDDLVVVISPHAGRPLDYQPSWRQFVPQLGGYPTVVKVVSTDETLHGIANATKEIIQKIDLSGAIAAAEHAKQVELVKAKIARAKKDALENMQLAALMDLSPELSDLVKELATLTGASIVRKPIPVRAHRRKATVSRKPKASVGKGSAKRRTTKK